MRLDHLSPFTVRACPDRDFPLQGIQLSRFCSLTFQPPHVVALSPGEDTRAPRLSVEAGRVGIRRRLIHIGESRRPSRFPGGHRRRVTPVPIPNTEVKPSTADGTAWATAWESRSLPGIFLNARYWRRYRAFLLYRQRPCRRCSAGNATRWRFHATYPSRVRARLSRKRSLGRCRGFS